MLGSSWLLKGILRHLNIMYPTKVNLSGGGAHFSEFLPGPGGPPGRGYRGGD